MEVLSGAFIQERMDTLKWILKLLLLLFLGQSCIHGCHFPMWECKSLQRSACNQSHTVIFLHVSGFHATFSVKETLEKREKRVLKESTLNEFLPNVTFGQRDILKENTCIQVHFWGKTNAYPSQELHHTCSPLLARQIMHINTGASWSPESGLSQGIESSLLVCWWLRDKAITGLSNKEWARRIYNHRTLKSPITFQQPTVTLPWKESAQQTLIGSFCSLVFPHLLTYFTMSELVFQWLLFYFG